jgi:hypothetical protein
MNSRKFSKFSGSEKVVLVLVYFTFLGLAFQGQPSNFSSKTLHSVVGSFMDIYLQNVLKNV